MGCSVYVESIWDLSSTQTQNSVQIVSLQACQYIDLSLVQRVRGFHRR